MKPIVTDTTNCVLTGPEGSNIMDLPITKVVYGDGEIGLESCWELDEKELREVNRTGKLYFICIGNTQPPICLSPYSSLLGKAEGQYDTEVNPLTVCHKNPSSECYPCKEEACQGKYLAKIFEKENIKPREQVQWFAEEMEKVLRNNDHKGGWDKYDDGYLVWMLRNNLAELTELIFQESKDVQKVIKEAVDVANFAMMIADNARRVMDAKS